MPLHNASTRDDLPHYENPHKQEAVQFLARDIDEQPLIDGMDDLDRVDAWQQVVDRFEGKGSVATALQKRRAELEGDLEAQAEFEPASETDDGQEAIADGGAEVVEESEPEVNDEQESVTVDADPRDVMQYANEAERARKKSNAMDIATTWTDPETVREKISEERASDTVRPHVIDALEERLEVLEQ